MQGWTPDSDTRGCKAPAAADAAGNRAERDLGSRRGQAGAERGRAHELEEVPARGLSRQDTGRSPCQRVGHPRVRAESGGVTGGHWHGWSPECDLGVHGMLMSVKHRQQPCGDGHEHSEHQRQALGSPRCGQTTRRSSCSPAGSRLPASTACRAWSCTAGMASRRGCAGPPPQPTQWTTEPSDTFARERTRQGRPAGSMPRNLKSCRRDDFRASARASSAGGGRRSLRETGGDQLSLRRARTLSIDHSGVAWVRPLLLWVEAPEAGELGVHEIPRVAWALAAYTGSRSGV